MTTYRSNILICKDQVKKAGRALQVARLVSKITCGAMSVIIFAAIFWELWIYITGISDSIWYWVLGVVTPLFAMFVVDRIKINAKSNFDLAKRRYERARKDLVNAIAA